jgi:hypothetical protein
MAQQSIQRLYKRAEMARDVMAKTPAAKADGVITAKEECQIYNMHKKQLKLIRRDMK